MLSPKLLLLVCVRMSDLDMMRWRHAALWEVKPFSVRGIFIVLLKEQVLTASVTAFGMVFVAVVVVNSAEHRHEHK